MIVMVQTKDFKINHPDDVKEFFYWLTFDCKISFHPDDPFDNYVSIENGQPTFTDEQCKLYDKVMDDCFDVCDKYGCDVYEIANKAFWHFVKWRNYLDMKAKHPNALLLSRDGDFYVTYEDDAQDCSYILGITLTKFHGLRLASFPHHAIDTYLTKLIRAGKRVAICEL